MIRPLQETEFFRAFNGRFSGVLRWPQFDILWQALTLCPEGWYVYEPEAGVPPVAPLSAADMLAFLGEAEGYLRENCMRDCCGAVYADSFESPSFVKVYNPRLMGGCGMGKAPLPHWVICRLEPVSLIEDTRKEEGLFGRLFNHQPQAHS